MSFFDAVRHRLRPLLRPRTFDRELEEELRLHIELDAGQQGDGHDDVSARHLALQHFGHMAYYKEETRRMTVLGWLDILRQDLRYGLRALRRAPVFTGVAVLSLALGIGANTAIFGLLHRVLLATLPVPHPGELVTARVVVPRGFAGGFALDEVRALREAPGAPPLAVFTSAGNVALEAAGERDFATVDLVDGEYFRILGLRPVVGRLLSPEDDRAAQPVVVISEDWWDRYFHRDPAVLQRTVTLRNVAFAIVGVLPGAFHGLVFPGEFAVAAPLSTGALIGGPDPQPARGGGSLVIIGRLTSGASIARGSAALDAVFQRCCADRHSNVGGKPGALGAAPTAPAGKSAAAAPRLILQDISRGIPMSKMDIRTDYGRILLVLMGGVAVVLLIACANVGNLLLVRAAARGREFAVRLSIGASRGRLVRQLLTESVLLAFLGGALGLALAWWATNVLASSLPPMGDGAGIGLLGEIVRFRASPAVLEFTAAMSVACVALFGLLPALRSTKTDLVSPLKESGHGHGSRRRGMLDPTLVVAQVALALLLVSSAALLGTTLRNLRAIDGGFATTHVLGVDVDTRGTSYEQGGMVPLHRELVARLQRLPGVRAAAMASITPAIGGRWSITPVTVPGYVPSADDDMTVSLDAITPGFLDVAGIPLTAGRDFADGDGPSAGNVAIINTTLVHRFFGTHDPIGATIRVGGDSGFALRVVGVARDTRYRDLRMPAEPMVYVPVRQSGSWPYLVAIVRTTADPAAVARLLRNEITAFAPGVRLRAMQTVEDALDQALSRERLAAGLATLFGALALGLAAVGLYGVVSYNVTRRTSEIGLRMAMGARPADVVRLVLRGSMIMVLAGLALGLPLMLAGGRAIAALLYGVGSHDFPLLAAAMAALAAVGIAASAVPALRASRIDPLVALRSD
jgi:predicted permease